jgi:23S rRNA (guanosine2251-2'-O)-methyltransferase
VAFIWGRHPVYEALRARRPADRLYVATGTKPLGILVDILKLGQEQGIPIQTIDRRALDRMAEGANHQGVVAEVAEYRYRSLADVLASSQVSGELPLILALDSLEDPQNFGTLLRTAEAVGVTGAIIPLHRSVGVTPAVEKASAGAVEFVAIARVTNLPRALDELKRAGYWVVGLAGEGDVLYDAFRVDVPLVLVIGAEGRGLGRLVRESCDIVAKIPMFGHLESLNAAVAGSIVLADIRRRRHELPPKRTIDVQR